MLKRSALVFFALLAIYILSGFLFPFPTKKVPEGFEPQYGTSYSFEQAGWYGYDGRAGYVKLLDEVKFDWIRLPFFWDQMVDSNGDFNKNFEDVEFAVIEAQKRDVKVVVALGLKVPYYPEYHLPSHIKDQISFGQTIDTDHTVANSLLAIDRKVVHRLSKYKNISHWQVENEPFLANVNNWKIDKSLVEAEVRAVRETDPLRRPIILSSVGPASFNKSWKQYFELLAPGDSFGVNAYFKTQGINLFSFKLFDREVNLPWPKFFVWPVQPWHGLSPNFGSLGEYSKERNVDFWILEAQAEPYVRTLEDAKRENSFFSAEDIAKVDSFLKSERTAYVGFWGANYWIYREKLGDRSWIDAIGAIVN